MPETDLEERVRDALQVRAEEIRAGEHLDERVAARRTSLRRAHRTRRLLAVAAVLAVIAGVVAVVTAAGGDDPVRHLRTVDSSTTTTTTAPAALPEGWSRLPDPPLAARSGAIAGWTGQELVVAGGATLGCAPNVDCAVHPGRAFRDGAAFDPVARRWRPIAVAQWTLSNLPTAVMGGDVYVLRSFCEGKACDTGRGTGLVRYRPDVDRWERVADLPVDGYQTYLLAGDGDVLVAYSGTDEQGEVPDLRYDPDSDQWREVPNDPLPLVYDRTWSIADGVAYVFGTPLPTEGDTSGPASKLGARLDLATGRWTELPQAPGTGFQAWLVDDSIVVNPHFGRDAAGARFDIPTGAWTALPPLDESGWTGDMAGALGPRSATVTAPSGWVLDTSANRWLQILGPDGRDQLTSAGIATVGRDLYVVGGEQWISDPPAPTDFEGELFGDAWVWRAPPAG